MSFYLGRLGRIPLFVAWKLPFVASLAKGLGKIPQKLSRGYYIPGLTIEAYRLAKGLALINKPVVIQANEGAFCRVDRQRVLAENPLTECFPDRQRLQINVSSPEEIAGLFRLVKKSVRSYQLYHGNVSVWKNRILPFLIGRAATVKELRQLEKEAFFLVDGYARKFEPADPAVPHSLPFYVAALFVMLQRAAGAVERARKIQRRTSAEEVEIFIKDLQGRDKQAKTQIYNYSNKHGDPVLYVRVLLPALLGKKGSLTGWSKRALARVNAYVDSYRQNPSTYMQLLAVTLNGTRRPEGFEYEVKIFDALIKDHQTSYGKGGALSQYIWLLGVLRKGCKNEQQFNEWVGAVDIAIRGYYRTGRGLSDFINKIIPVALKKTKNVKQFKAWVERMFPGSFPGDSPAPAEAEISVSEREDTPVDTELPDFSVDRPFDK